MKHNSFTDWIEKYRDEQGHKINIYLFAHVTGIHITTINGWCYKRFNPGNANLALARRFYKDFPDGGGEVLTK